MEEINLIIADDNNCFFSFFFWKQYQLIDNINDIEFMEGGGGL